MMARHRMERGLRQQKPRRPRGRPSTLRDAVDRALDAAFPDGVVQFLRDPDESWLADREETLKTALARLAGASLLFDRGRYGWSGHGNELPSDEPLRSYHVFFVGLRGEQFSYPVPSETIAEVDFDDEVNEHDEDDGGDPPGWTIGVRCTATVGCTVAVSLLAPVALVTPDVFERSDDGETMIEPGPHVSRFTLDGHPLDALSPEQPARQIIGDEGMQKLSALRQRILTLLEKLDVVVVTDAEAERAVPGLRAGEETLLAHPNRITIRDAFFFLEL